MDIQPEANNSSHLPPIQEKRSQPSLDFAIDENYLLAHTLCSIRKNTGGSSDNLEHIRALYDHSSKRSEMVTRYICDHPLMFLRNDLPVEELALDIADHLLYLRSSGEFSAIHQETHAYLCRLREEWLNNLELSCQIITEITGIDFVGSDYRVFVTHPALPQGAYVGGNVILWGGPELWQNYSTVYLWHEIHHSILGVSDVSHAIIELITDNELRVRLNSGDYPPLMGHPQLNHLKQKILPYWTQYLELPRRNVFEFEWRMLQQFKLDAESSVW